MAKIKYEVELVGPEELKAQIQKGGIRGDTLVSVSPAGDSFVLVWQKPGRETR